MAKINKTETSKTNDASSSAEANEKTVTEKKVQKKTKKAAASGGKVSKQHPKNPPIADMVKTALTTLKDHKGSSLIAIKKFITNNYGLQMTKARQTLIKKAMRTEFDEGRIQITNGDGDSIDFKKLFTVTSRA